jgi:hypothetical protein
MRTAHTTKSIEDYLNDFAGRKTGPGYDDTKLIKIAEENRDFVWNEEKQQKFIESILTGFPIPQMVICDNCIMDGGNRSTVLMRWKQNEFEVTVGDWTGNYKDMTPTLCGRWNRCAIPMTVITGADDAQRSQIYENYNSGVVMTTGNLLWNRKKLFPLVGMAAAMIGQDGMFPFADLIRQVWKKSWTTTKTRNELAFAYSILAGSLFGPDFFHTKFHVHLGKMTETKAADIDLSKLRSICEVLRSADPHDVVAPKKKEQVFKKFIGAMIYDVHTLGADQFEEKWRSFCEIAYMTITPGVMKKLIDVGTARATNSSRIQRLSENVATFIANPHTDAEDDTDYSSDQESDDSF